MIRALERATPDEIIALRQSYGGGYVVESQELHFIPGPGRWWLHTLETTQTNARLCVLLAMNILRRIQRLTGVPDSSASRALSSFFEEDSEAAEILASHQREDIEVGDFVLANGYLARVEAKHRSRYGYAILERDLPSVQI